MKFKFGLALPVLGFTMCLLLFVVGVPAQMQDKPKAAPSAASANTHMSDQVIRGEGLFLQRCSLCHLAKVIKPYKSFGPNLKGVLKDADAEQVAFIREFISNGVPDKMPGFRAALSSDQFDDLIAYLKTF